MAKKSKKDVDIEEDAEVEEEVEEEEEEEEEDEEEEEEEEDEEEKPKKGKVKVNKAAKKEEDEEDEEEADEDAEEEDEEEEEEDEEDDEEEEEEEEEEDEDDDATEGAADGWMFSGKKADKKIAENAANMGVFVPTLWMKDGETRKVRFHSAKPIAMILQHSLPRVGKKGFDSFTCPGKKCDVCKAGQFPSAKFIHDVTNLTPWKDKNGKKHLLSSQFMELSNKREKPLTRLLATLEKQGGVSKHIIEVARDGEGSATTWSFTPVEKKSKTEAEAQYGKELKNLRADFKKYYAPPTPEKLKLFARRVARGAEMDE